MHMHDESLTVSGVGCSFVSVIAVQNGRVRNLLPVAIGNLRLARTKRAEKRERSRISSLMADFIRKMNIKHRVL